MKKPLVEFFGTFMVTFAVANALVGRHPIAAVAGGAALVVATCFGAPISGAHFNPAISLAAWRRGLLSSGQLWRYVLAQVVAAALAALLTEVVQGPQIEEFAKASLAVAMKTPLAKPMSVFVAESAWTAVMAYVLIRSSSPRRVESPLVLGFLMGLSLMAGGIALTDVSGGVVNPATYVSLCILDVKSWVGVPLFWGAQCVGALAACELLKRTDPDAP